MPVREYNLDGIKHREEMIPDGWCLVETYTPHSTPWDCYGRKWGAERSNVMREANIPAQVLHTRMTVISPIGSGPNGRVRFGDNMCPGLWRLVVQKHEVCKAVKAMAAHQKAIHDWLHNDGEMPQACRTS